MRDSAWTEERIALLKQLAEEGLTCSQISERMGGVVTRNAVIGKINRLKLVHNSSRKPKATTNHLVKAAPTPRYHAATGTGHKRQFGKQFGAQPPSAALVRVPGGLPYCEIYVAPTQRKGIIDLEPGDCKWPIGDPLHPTFHFCGREQFNGTPYCAHHAQIAYEPPEPKRKRATAEERESDKSDAPVAVNDNVEKEMA